MDTTQKRKAEENDCTSTEAQVVVDLSIDAQWTPGRSQRAADRTKKVRSAEDGPLTGDDWVLNEQGGGATLSFCFENQEKTECFGLTVGHLTQSVGDPVFRFSESEPIPVPGDSEMEEYFMFEIERVESISTETDSLVFRMMHGENYEPMRIALSPQTHVTLSGSLVSSLAKPPNHNSLFVGFGAQRRGARCIVDIPSKPSPGEYSFIGD